MNTTSASEERSALTKVMWFGIIELVGIVGVWVGVYFVFINFFNASLFTSLPTNPTPSQVANALGPIFQDITYIIPIAVGIELVGLVVLTMGFRGLAKVDKARFHISTPFMLVLIFGVLIVAGGAVSLLGNIPNVIANAINSSSCTGGGYYGYSITCTPSAAFFNQFSSLFAYVGVILLGGILSLIGYIGGLILGLWRVGSRYNQTTLKLGAIFQIIPLLQIVAPILIILGANEAKNTVSG
jgi:hypothetical protein